MTLDQQHEQDQCRFCHGRQEVRANDQLQHLGTTLCKDGTCSAEIHIRIASAMAAMARLNRIWQCKTTSFASKFKLYKSLVISNLLYGCETWTLFADYEERMQAFKTKCLRKLFRISYLRALSTPLWIHRNVFWQLSRNGHLHGSSMSHATTASPKPSFRAPWKVSDTGAVSYTHLTLPTS